MKNLLLIVCLIAYNTFAQNIATVDSILNTVDVEDTSHIHKTIDALNLAKELDYNKGEARAFHCLGFIYTMKGSFPLSMDKYLRSAELYKQIGDEEKRAVVLVNIAYVFHRMKDYKQEIKYAEEAISISKEDSIKVYAYNCLGKAKMGQGETKEALKFFNKAIGIKEGIGQTNDIHQFYTALGVSYVRAKMYDSAITTFWKVYRYSNKNLDVLARMYNNLGTAYHLKGEYQNAELNYLESIHLAVKKESGSACLNYAELLHQRGEPQKAKAYLAKGLQYDYDLSHLGRTLFAMEMFRESSLVRDSLYMHATKDFEQLRNTSVSIATIESDLRNAREKAALREVAEYKSKWLWAAIALSLIGFAITAKYLWDYRSLLANVKLNNKKIGEYFTALGQKT